MAIYLDVIWMLNFLFDTLLLYLTAIILKRQVSYLRLLLGGLFGSVIILLSVTPLHAFSGHPIVKMLFSILMVMAVFGYKRFRYFVTGLTTFYFITFLIGGTLIGTHYFVGFDFDLSSSVMLASVKGFGDPISWMFVLIGFPVAWHFSKTGMERVETAKIQFDHLVNVTLFLNEMELKFKGLVDSGNQLYDPISKYPVMLISITKRVEDLPASIIQVAQNPDQILFESEKIPADLEGKLKIIPCKVMGKEHQLIIAIKPDKIVIHQETSRYSITKGLVSFTMQELSSEDAFQCIVHPKMLTGPKDCDETTKVS